MKVISSLSRTLVPSSPVLVELRLWRVPGAERRDTLSNIISLAFNLFQRDIGGNDFTRNRRWRQRYIQDGSRPVIFDAIYEFSFLSVFWHLFLG